MSQWCLGAKTIQLGTFNQESRGLVYELMGLLDDGPMFSALHDLDRTDGHTSHHTKAFGHEKVRREWRPRTRRRFLHRGCGAGASQVISTGMMSKRRRGVSSIAERKDVSHAMQTSSR